MLVGKRLVILEPYQYEPYLPFLRLPTLLGVGIEIGSYQDANDKKLPHGVPQILAVRTCGSYYACVTA